MCGNTIPIYWGDPQVGRHFNTESFVNIKNIPNTTGQLTEFDRAIERIKELDQNPDLYRDIFSRQYYTELAIEREKNIKNNIQNFITGIFDKERPDLLK